MSSCSRAVPALVLFAVLALIEPGATRAARADSTTPLPPHRPPATLYPAGTTFTVTDPLSNPKKSCQWNLNCFEGGTPHTHTQDEDSLGRIGGWMTFAEWHGKHGKQMTFTLFGSAYDTPAHARAAAADYNAQLTSDTFEMTAFACPSFVSGTDARQFCARYHDHSQVGGHYFSLAASEGNMEIELLSHANTRYQDLRRLTFAQAQAAMALSPEPAPQR